MGFLGVLFFRGFYFPGVSIFRGQRVEMYMFMVFISVGY